jgi:hypothetical protein
MCNWFTDSTKKDFIVFYDLVIPDLKTELLLMMGE